LTALFADKKKPSSGLRLSSLGKKDFSQLVEFLQQDILIHRHLDWRPPAEWLGEKPFLAAEENGKIQAVLAMPDDPPGIFWVRLFALHEKRDFRSIWEFLLAEGLQQMAGKNHQPLAALAYSDWFRQLLASSRWEERQRVVLLKFRGRSGEIPTLDDDYLLRPMVSSDMFRVTEIDQECFEPLWQQSEDATRRAYAQTSYSSVMEYSHHIIGYQMTTFTAANAHLARLAVLPQCQGTGVGTALVMDMIQRVKQALMREITVNTQQDNPNSIRLYQKLGFELTGESFPILIYPQ
jgi:ribosomal protein S18 acetylase RimI-like enzyme